MSSWVITKTAAATSAARCSFRDADVISMFIRSSSDTWVRSRSGFCARAGSGRAIEATATRPTIRPIEFI